MKATIIDQTGSAGDGEVRVVLSLKAPPPVVEPDGLDEEALTEWRNTVGWRRYMQVKDWAESVTWLRPGCDVDVGPVLQLVAYSATATDVATVDALDEES